MSIGVERSDTDRRCHERITWGMNESVVKVPARAPISDCTSGVSTPEWYASRSATRYQMTADAPKYRPLERFWPYAELSEQPTDQELAALDPDLHDVLFGAGRRPFSITLVFPRLDVPEFERALQLARESADFRETGSGPARRHPARHPSRQGARLRGVVLPGRGADPAPRP